VAQPFGVVRLPEADEPHPQGAGVALFVLRPSPCFARAELVTRSAREEIAVVVGAGERLAERSSTEQVAGPAGAHFVQQRERQQIEQGFHDFTNAPKISCAGG
jgi:hypothetical protein